MPNYVAHNVLSWTDDIDANTHEQVKRTAAMPFIEGHVALMPDAHYGMGSTIGSVIPTRGAIIPSAIGVDIGCGMIAVRTSLTLDQLPNSLDRLHGKIAKAVPAGVGKGHTNGTGMTDPLIATGDFLTDKQIVKAHNQFGSLGAGNHFVEICFDGEPESNVWVVLHSGSRGIGHELATQHIECAKNLMKAYFIKLDDPDLAYLVEDTPEFDSYIRAMLWAQAYAYENRAAMMRNVLHELAMVVGANSGSSIWQEEINCHHNFTQMEHHHGKNVWLTRKGAIRARAGDLGIIPGSMGTKTFIVKGKGSEASYDSCSHGAGRKMSRTKARKELSADTLRAAMVGKSWNDSEAEELVDEHPLAYKDIWTVMHAQSDLVEIKAMLQQVLNYKGTK